MLDWRLMLTGLLFLLVFAAGLAIRLWMLRRAVVEEVREREREREIDAELARIRTEAGADGGSGDAIRSRTESRRVVLRDESTREDIRHLEVRWLDSGEIVIEGHDLGPSVQEFFGYPELEWTWRIEASDTPKLRQALGAPPDLLRELERRFGGANAAQLGKFLKDNAIPYLDWMRIGD